jgi:hypothetical protein
MPIQYSDPETRNLSVTSVAFIAYFSAGGTFIDGMVNLSVINAKFTNPFILGVMAWVLLFWFFYRYWLTHYGKFSIAYWAEIEQYKNHPKIRSYFADNVREGALLDLKLRPVVPMMADEGWIINGISRVNGQAHIIAEYATAVERNNNGTVKAMHSSQASVRHRRERGDYIDAEIPFNGLVGRLIWMQLNIKYCFEQRAFTDYMTPYILFSVAILAALWCVVSQIDWSTIMNFCFLKDLLSDCTTTYVERCYICP